MINIATGALVPSSTAFQTQRRSERTPEQREEMAQSIKTMGIIQPLIVRKLDEYTPDASSEFNHLEAWQTTFYEIVAGEGRLDGAIAANLIDCPCIVKDLTAKQALEIQLLENLKRDSVSPLSEATGYAELRDIVGRSIDEIAAIFGFSAERVRLTLKFTELTTEEKTALTDRRISRKTAAALTGITDPQQRLYLFDRVTEDGIHQRLALGMITKAREIETEREKWENQIPTLQAYYPGDVVILDFTESLKAFDPGAVTLRFNSPYRLFDDTISESAIRQCGLEHGTTWGNLSDLLDHRPMIIRDGKGSATRVTLGLEHLEQIKAQTGAADDFNRQHPNHTETPEEENHHTPPGEIPNPPTPLPRPDFHATWLGLYIENAANVPFETYRTVISQMVPAAWIDAVLLSETHNEITWSLLGAHLETLGQTDPAKQHNLLKSLIK